VRGKYLNPRRGLLRRFKMATIQKRNTAYKLWISDLLNGNLVNGTDGVTANFFRVHNNDIHRVNLVGNVVFKYNISDGNYGSVTVDDGSGSIRLKAWREDTAIFENVNVGDMVLVIGRPRSFNNEVYINPEMIKVLKDPNWELVRKLELLKEYGPPSKAAEAIEAVDELSYEAPKPVAQNSYVEEEVVEDISETLRQKILTIIESNSEEKGLEISTLIKISGLDEKQVESTVNDLLSEGEVFEPRKGFLKVV
jgi:RPA family protein